MISVGSRDGQSPERGKEGKKLIDVPPLQSKQSFRTRRTFRSRLDLTVPASSVSSGEEGDSDVVMAALVLRGRIVLGVRALMVRALSMWLLRVV
jgi:hypothetical protein